MKNLISAFILLCLTLQLSYSQDRGKENFTVRMNNHVKKALSDPENMANAKTLYGHTCDIHRQVTEEEIAAKATDDAKTKFIHANMAEYKKLYFPIDNGSRYNPELSICENGGFESNFLYFDGLVSTYRTGSTSFTPLIGGVPVTWTPVVLPTTNRFEIMTTGTDPLIGIQKVKFGSKSLRINNSVGHGFPTCDGNYGVDRIVRSFKVTEQNKDFTIWYALALENPPGHINSQPFFSITCDLAPASDLCFDADILKCEKLYPNNCSPPFDSIDVLDWACHRINIPSSQIGQVATIEITVGDCGQGAHFGYAYIDGFCEECTGSSLGSGTFYDQPFDGEVGVDFYKCDTELDTLATICGRYTLPTLCDDDWGLDSVIITGYPNIIVNIDPIKKTYCFDFPISLLGVNNCVDLIAELYFSSSTNNIPVQYSNILTICQKDYLDYDYGAFVSYCYDNGTTDNISDDYYFVNLILGNINGASWSIERQLLYPYPGESGLSYLLGGAGNDNLNLGPFLIQEGSWDMIVSIGGCQVLININPPDFCSGCDKFKGLKITNVKCLAGPPDKWSFDILVPSSLSTPLGSGYTLTASSGTFSGVYGVITKTIDIGDIGFGCENITIKDNLIDECNAKITVCPPKPCSSSCPLEVNVVKRTCDEKGENYSVKLEVLNSGSSTVCYGTSVAGVLTVIGSFPANGILGPFSTDQTIVIFLCPTGNCLSCAANVCFKVLNIEEPHCESGDFEEDNQQKTSTTEELYSFHSSLEIVPNPIDNNEIRFISRLSLTQLEIYNSVGLFIGKLSFEGKEGRFDASNLDSGLYLVKYINHKKEHEVIKFIKR